MSASNMLQSFNAWLDQKTGEGSRHLARSTSIFPSKPLTFLSAQGTVCGVHRSKRLVNSSKSQRRIC